MSTAIAHQAMADRLQDAIEQSAAAQIERVLIKGDLSKLTEDQRVFYYHTLCESIGVNPLTRPFDYLQLGGKLVLYANKCCTDQLRTQKGISVHKLESKTEDGIYEVHAYVRNAEGREDADLGAVSIATLKGESLANAKMKATTKAKRRATLSICGLGILDESEIDSIPNARPVTAEEYIDTQAPTAAPAKQITPPAPQQPKAAKPHPTNHKDTLLAIGELVKELQSYGVQLSEIQSRMVRLTGASKRTDLNAGQATIVIEEFESWLNDLDERQMGGETK